MVKEGKIEGILYHKNIIENSNKNVLVKDVMETTFKTVKAKDNLNDIYNTIFSKKKAFIPVLKEEKLVGVIDANNLNEFILLQAKLSY